MVRTAHYFTAKINILNYFTDLEKHKHESLELVHLERHTFTRSEPTNLEHNVRYKINTT